MPLWGLRQQEHGPAQRVRRRFVACCYERQDVRSYLGFCEAAIDLTGLEQTREQIVGHALRLFGQNAAARANDLVDLRLEEFERRSHPEPAQPWNKIGRTKKIERTDFPDRLEIRRHSGADMLGVGAKSVREDGAFEDVERHLCHFR